MLQPVNGVLCVEDEQTGDGRYINPGALTWAPLPLPLAWITTGDQHVDMVMAGEQIGVISEITRAGNEIQFVGSIDDEIPAGAELLRRMGIGSASHGNQQFLSIDPDDWAYDVIDTTVEVVTGESPDAPGSPAPDEEPPEEDNYRGPVVASVSGRGPIPARSIVAAAGEGAPTGELVFSDTADGWIQSFSRLRIRGVTACAVSAFDGAYMQPGTPAAPAAQPPVVPPVVAASAMSAPASPPRDWFFEPEPDIDDERMVEQYDADGNPIGFACPLTILDSGQWYGHLAASWGQCHTGYQTCVNPPASAVDYAHFHVGEVLCAGGERVPTGNFVVGCDHAAASLLAQDARDHYAHSGLAWGDGRVTNGEHAPWACGALRPGIDDATLRVLRATTLSGDWRRIGGALELIVALSVNGPGFPIGREALAASAIPVLPAASTPETYFADGVQTALVAAAGAARCKECGGQLRVNIQPEFDAGVAKLIERRTRHLIPQARDAMLARIRGN
jgi:hypothetical protein